MCSAKHQYTVFPQASRAMWPSVTASETSTSCAWSSRGDSVLPEVIFLISSPPPMALAAITFVRRAFWLQCRKGGKSLSKRPAPRFGCACRTVRCTDREPVQRLLALFVRCCFHDSPPLSFLTRLDFGGCSCLWFFFPTLMELE